MGRVCLAAKALSREGEDQQQLSGLELRCGRNWWMIVLWELVCTESENELDNVCVSFGSAWRKARADGQSVFGGESAVKGR